MVFKVEVLAIYENPGVAPSGARVTQRDNDFQLAQDRAALVGHAIAEQPDEYMEKFGDAGTPSRYGFGWRCGQWITVKADADTVGQAVFTRLATRSLQNGSKVEVFSRDESASVYTTGPATYRRLWPTPNAGDIG